MAIDGTDQKSIAVGYIDELVLDVMDKQWKSVSFIESISVASPYY